MTCGKEPHKTAVIKMSPKTKKQRSEKNGADRKPAKKLTERSIPTSPFKIVQKTSYKRTNMDLKFVKKIISRTNDLAQEGHRNLALPHYSNHRTVLQHTNTLIPNSKDDRKHAQNQPRDQSNNHTASAKLTSRKPSESSLQFADFDQPPDSTSTPTGSSAPRR